MSGDVNLFTPGARPPVVVVADVNGDVAQRGDIVEIVGETPDGVEVALNQTAGGGVGHLLRTPEDYDDTAAYAQGDSAGDSTLGLRHYVDWFKGDAATLTAGDLVVSAAGGGVRALDQDGTAPDDADNDILGPVWRTGSHGAGTSSKVAVVRHR